MKSAVAMVLLLPLAAALLLFALVRMVFFRRFTMSVLITSITGVAMLLASLMAIP